MAKFCECCANNPDWRDRESDEGEYVGPSDAWFCALCLVNFDIVGWSNKRARKARKVIECRE